MPISATNVVFGFRSIFRGLLSECVEENKGFEGCTPFAYVTPETKLKSALKLDFRVVAQFWRELRPQSQIMALILPIFEGKSVFRKVSLFGAGNA